VTGGARWLIELVELAAPVGEMIGSWVLRSEDAELLRCARDDRERA
jgi:hypothetical protein